MKAYRHLVIYALAKDCTVSVWDGEEWQIKRSANFDAIVDAIESVEEAELNIRSLDDAVTWVRVSAFGLADDETVVDCHDNKFMQEWENSYEKYVTIQSSTTERIA
jgi:hypothetical protein